MSSSRLKSVPDLPPDPLVGRVVRLPGGDLARVLMIEHEYDDGTTLEYVSGDYAGAQTMCDTYRVRKYEVVGWPEPEWTC